MDNIFLNLNEETRINLALSYENGDIIKKFCSEHEVGEEYGNECFIELKKFLYLCGNTSEKLAPSSEIDKIWHTFILFTKEYREYCMHFIGKFIDHVPDLKKDLSPTSENYLLNTVKNYESVFGTLKNNIWQINFGEDDCSNCFQCRSDCLEGDSQSSSCVYTGNCASCSNDDFD
jgi:hypothetical protein